jgi:hypothetical protein
MNEINIKQIIKPENGIEEAIISDVEFISGVNYGKPRPGHKEGKVIYHIKEVLDNIDKFYGDDEDRSNLRLIAILHDTFKNKVNQNLPKSGNNHHGHIARRFAKNYILNNNTVLNIIEHHDDAYNAWCKGDRHDNWFDAGKRANTLIRGLLIEGDLDLYVKFYRCDNATGDKKPDSYNWFNWFVELIK